MSEKQVRDSTTLRLWPGVLAVILLWSVRFGTKIVMPGFDGFSRGMMGGLVLALVVLLWWAFFSRAPRLDRVGFIALLLGSLAAAWALKHPTMGPHWLVGYAVPTLWLAFVASAVMARNLADGARRRVMAAAILLVSAGWTLARTDGINGDHDASFAWRWQATSEQQLLTAKDSTSAASATLAGATSWHGFRGTDRKGHVTSPPIATDWSTVPPELLWRRPVGPGWSSFAVHGDYIYTQEQRGEDEVVSCYRLSTGEPVWQHGDPVRFFESNAGAGPRGTPTLDQGRLYTLGATGILNALDAVDGTVVWSRNMAEDSETPLPEWGFSSSPLVIDDTVIVAAAGRLVAYGVADGALRWQGPDGGLGYSSPHGMTLAGVPQVVLLSGTGATSVAPADGRVLWQHEWRGYPMIQPALTESGDLLINAGEGSGIRRLEIRREADQWTVSKRWGSRGLKPYFNDFVVHRGHGYGFDGRILSCIDLENGERQWKGGRYGSGQMVLIPDQDLLLVLSERGELALVEAKPDGFKELGRLSAIEGKTWNHPVVVGDVVLVRNGEQMAAFRLPPAP